MAYDIIGDVHGHATELVALLRRLGYAERQGAWRHPDRTAVFVGDLIDYGDEQLSTWAERVRGQPWEEVFVFFKHEDEGKGPALAHRFLEIAAAP
jgi:uncharacterized protein YecE (DUF72 family)